MRKATKLYALLGVLAAVSVTAFAVSRYEAKKEEIKSSGDVILEISSDTVTALSWTNESGSFSFTKTDGTWHYDEDEAFPVDADKIENLLSQFASFTAAFTIENVEDYSQYGLEEPTASITLTTEDATYDLKLGDFSTMDQERYLSIGDGNAYLATVDPLDTYDAVLSDVVLNDEIPTFDAAETLTFEGNENYTITRNEEEKSLCSEDVYFTEDKPLDTDKVESFLTSLQALDLSDYVTYNATEEELETYGMNNPDLTISLSYTSEDEEDGEEETEDETKDGTLVLSLYRNAEEEAAYEKAVEDGDSSLPEVSCYARVGDSSLIYQIDRSDYETLTGVSYAKLRHQEVFSGDFDTVTAIDVTMNGESYSFTYTPADEKATENIEGEVTYGEETYDASDLKEAIEALTLGTMAENAATDTTEISLTLHLNNEDFPTFTVTLYRYDGTNCLAVSDGNEDSFVSRSEMVALTEAVNAIILEK